MKHSVDIFNDAKVCSWQVYDNRHLEWGFQWAVYQYRDWKTRASTENDLRNPPKAGCHQSRGPQGREVGGVGWLDWSERFNGRYGIWVVPWKEGRVWLCWTVLREHSRHTRREGGKSRKGGKSWGQRRQMRYFPILPWDTPWAECLWRAAGYWGPMGVLS